MVSATETIKPPMMTRAKGAYASLPVSSFNAMGRSPTIVASEVIRIGRRRMRQEWATASRNPPSLDAQPVREIHDQDAV